MNNTTVLAIDQSSVACGLAVVHGQALLWSDVVRFQRTKCVSHSLKRRLLIQTVLDVCHEYQPDYIVMEQARLFSSDGKTGKTYVSRAAQRVLDRLIGAVTDAVYPLPVYVLGTQQWKYAVLSSRTATKSDAVWYVLQVFGKTVGHDEAESVCMGLCAASQPGMLERAE